MAEAAEQSEPTMEEILASIRKIIATETPPPQAQAVAEEDVLELTEIVEDEEAALPQPEEEAPAPVAELIAEEAAPQAPEPPPEAVAEVVEEPAVVEPPKPAEKPVEEKAPDAESLVSDDATALTATSFSQLAQQLETQRVTLEPHIEVGDGKQTLENVVIEIMRPLLKEWLDANLPATVEKLVQNEIQRIVRRHGD